MEILSRFGQRDRFPSTMITYPCQNQDHKQDRESSTEIFATMGCDTRRWSSAGTQYKSYS